MLLAVLSSLQRARPACLRLPSCSPGLTARPSLPSPPAAFYMVLGSLYLKADSWMLEREDGATEAAYRRCNLGTMCLSFG